MKLNPYFSSCFCGQWLRAAASWTVVPGIPSYSSFILLGQRLGNCDWSSRLSSSSFSVSSALNLCKGIPSAMEKWHLLVWSPSMALAHDTAVLALKKGQYLPWNPIFMWHLGSWLLQLSSWAGGGKNFGPLGKRKRFICCWADLVTMHFQGLNTVSVKGSKASQEWSMWFQTQWFYLPECQLFTYSYSGYRAVFPSMWKSVLVKENEFP